MKLHPLSIPYRALERWSMLLAGFVFFGFVGGLNIVAIGVLTVLLFGAIIAWEIAYHKRFEYRLAPPVFEIKSGVVSRREREIPLRRIQNVDINRNVVHRVFNLAMVDLETAGGDATEARLRYVSFPRAKWLQDEIRRLNRDAEDHPGPPDRQETRPEVLFELEPTELLVLSLTSYDARILGLLAFALPFASPGIPWGWIPPAPLGALVIAAAVLALFFASWVTGAFVTFVTYFGFRLSRFGDDLQIERGLLSRYDGSVPMDKIQTLTVQDNPLKRALGYATLRIETAGYSPQQTADEGSQSAVPLARQGRALALARTLEDVAPFELKRPPKRSRTRYMIRYALALSGLVGILFAVETTLGIPDVIGVAWYHPWPLVLLAPIAGHLKWKHRGYATGDAHVITRTGFWNRHTKIVPYYRVQNAISTQTILQRRWALASVTADTAGSFSLKSRSAQALDIDEARAQTLQDSIHDRLQASLARDEVQTLLESEIGRSVLDEYSKEP